MPHASIAIGPYEVTPLCDGWAPLPLHDELPGIEVDWDAERERYDWSFPPDDPASWAWHVHAFLVRHPDGLALVDTGIGDLGRPPYDVRGRLEEELRSLGVANGDVSDVVFTHLHGDHSGGTTSGGGGPRFPNARHYVHPLDWAFFGAERAPGDFTGRFEMAAIEGAGLLDLDAADHQVGPGLSLVHAPGHTPGHRVVRLGDDDDTLLLTGDLLHVPPQFTHPLARSNHDEDPDVGSEHRARHVEAARAGGWTVGVTHFARPFGRVVGLAGGASWASL